MNGRDLFKFSVIQQGGDQHHKTGACIVNQRTGGGVQDAEHGTGNGDKVDAHGEGDTELYGCYSGV